MAAAVVFSLGLGLMAHNNIHTFGYGYDKLRFIKSAFGDTPFTPIRTYFENSGGTLRWKRSKVSHEVFKVLGELVCSIVNTLKQASSATPRLSNSNCKQE